MLQYEELRLRLEELKPAIDDLKFAIGVEKIKQEIAQLEDQAAAPDFWEDMKNSQAVLQKTSQLKAKVTAYEQLCSKYDDAMTTIEIADEENDESLYGEACSAVSDVEKDLEEQKLTTLLSGEYDAKNAILAFHAGAGGTEAQDWVEMLYRMYQMCIRDRPERVL